MIPTPRRLLVIAIGALATSVLLIRMCAILYGCGCTWWWAGATDHCNMHMPGVPHCPWCDGGNLGFGVVALIIVLFQIGALRLARRRFGEGLVPALGALAVGLVLGALVAGAGGALLTGYPYLLGVRF